MEENRLQEQWTKDDLHCDDTKDCFWIRSFHVACECILKTSFDIYIDISEWFAMMSSVTYVVNFIALTLFAISEAHGEKSYHEQSQVGLGLPFGSLEKSLLSEDNSIVIDEEHQSKIDYIREVLRNVPMTDKFRKHVYRNSDPFDFDLQDFSMNAVWRKVKSKILSDPGKTKLFVNMVHSYMERPRSLSSEGTSFVKEPGRADPETREQIGGYEGCSRDYEAYILSVTDEMLRGLLLRIRQWCNITPNPPVCELVSNLLMPDPARPPTWAIPGRFIPLVIHITGEWLSSAVVIILCKPTTNYEWMDTVVTTRAYRHVLNQY